MTMENTPHILTSADSCIYPTTRFDIYHGNWKSITMNRRYTWASLTHTTHTHITQYTHLHTSNVGVYNIATLYTMPTCQRQNAAKSACSGIGCSKELKEFLVYYS